MSDRRFQISHQFITNGVHAGTDVGALAGVRRRFRSAPRKLPAAAVPIPLEDIRRAHAEAKVEMLAEVERRTGVRLDPGALTIGFARRATAYKRGDLLFSNLTRLKQIVRRAGPIQVLYAGKAHPRDESGKATIRNIFEAAAALQDVVKVVYIVDYDIASSKHLCRVDRANSPGAI